MSFLNSVLSSIETGDSSVTKPPVVRPSPAVAKPPSTQHVGTTTGQKRRAEDEARPGDKPRKISRPSSPMRSNSQKSTPVPTSSSNKPAKPRPISKPTAPSPTPTKTPGAAVSPSPAKPPPKGSYAEIMLRAQALQNKAPTNLGMIKHQSAPKERVSKVSKRRAMEAKKREADAAKGKTAGLATQDGAVGKASGAKSALLKSRPENEYKGTARPPPKEPAVPAYKGTAGLPSKRGLANGRPGLQSRNDRARGRTRDEYLGTDEEDEGDYGDYDEGDYYSDESSDMEAGMDDVEREEQEALRLAKREDEEELRLEMAAKKEKEARKKKLAQLSAKSRR